MDEEGTISLPFPSGTRIKEDFVGSHFANYDSFLILSHFKGHAMGGYGGAIKNMSIGIASTAGKCWIHTAGNSMSSPWGGVQDHFLESVRLRIPCRLRRGKRANIRCLLLYR